MEITPEECLMAHMYDNSASRLIVYSDKAASVPKLPVRPTSGRSGLRTPFGRIIEIELFLRTDHGFGLPKKEVVSI